MYRLRQMDVDDKVCEQVDVALLAQVYPKAVIQRRVEQSRRVAPPEQASAVGRWLGARLGASDHARTVSDASGDVGAHHFLAGDRCAAG